MEMQSSRREFIKGAAAFAVCSRVFAEEDAAAVLPPPVEKEAGARIRVRFLGSGAAGWKASWAEKHPFRRRQSSALLDGRALIDFTECSFDLLPEGCRPEVLFQTHSHGDHFNPAAAVKSGVKRMYVHESWAAAARRLVGKASEELSLPAPEVVALPFAAPVEECGLRFTAVPANHGTSRVTDGVLERAALYLVEKGSARLLYATDTGGIPCDAARMIGIDPHISDSNFANYAKAGAFVAPPKAITALIMEATDGDSDEDFRLFTHSSAQTVVRTVNMLRNYGRFAPPDGKGVFLTHLGIKYRDWPSSRIEEDLPDGFRAASDGLEVLLG